MTSKASVKNIIEKRKWQAWMAAHLPDSEPIGLDLPVFLQVDYPAYQLEAVDIAEARKRLVSLLFDSRSQRFVAVLLGPPLPLAYWVGPSDVCSLLVEKGRQDEFLCLVSLEPPGEVLIEHPPEDEGEGPFWLSAAGGLEALVSRFGAFFPGGDFHRSSNMELSSRERSGLDSPDIGTARR